MLSPLSAGVGRTGTFIALDALYRQGMKEDKINIVEYINTMREDRMNMIQNFVSRTHRHVQSDYNFRYKALNKIFLVFISSKTCTDQRGGGIVVLFLFSRLDDQKNALIRL